MSDVSVKKNELIGLKFQRLMVIADGGRCKKQNILWLCRCDCGNETTVRGYDLKSGKVKSCGCYNREKQSNLKHGQAGSGKKRNPVYSIWASLIQRCVNPNDRSWKHYGGRGIAVCDRWRESFENFLADMGERPTPKHSIDRIDVNGNYEPGNCRWATVSEQNLNRRNNTLITVGDVTKPLKLWVDDLGVTQQCVYYWIKKGLSYGGAIERILSKKQSQEATQ